MTGGSSKKKDSQRIDQHYRRFLEQGVELKRHIRLGENHFSRARGCAFEMAQEYVQGIGKDINKWLSLTASEGFADIDRWLDSWFSPFDALPAVGDYLDLLAAVQGGMTLKEFLGEMPITWNNKKNKRKMTKSRSIPPKPTNLPINAEARAELWKERAEALDEKYKEACRELLGLRREVLSVRKDHKRILRILERTLKSTG